MLATGIVNDAEVALARAHGAEAEKYAPYETTLADLYLMKAKEEQGHARYSDAKLLAADALKYAEAATRKAAERRTTVPVAPTPTATVEHPDLTPQATQPPPTPQPPAPADKPPARQPKAPIDPGKLP